MSQSNKAGARSRARELIVQSLYQKQISEHDIAELLRQFHDHSDYERVDQQYFNEVIKGICADIDALEAVIAELADRPLAQLDPVEHGILLLGIYELRSVPEIPFRVVINESVNLTKLFGAIDGHKYVNALLDRAAKQLRTGQ